MKLLVSHVLKDFLASLLLSLAIMTAVMGLFMALGFERQAERYGTDVLTLYGSMHYLMPHILMFTLPISFLMAGVLAFGRLEGSGEISAMRAAGVRLTTVIAPVLGVAIVAAVMLLVLVEWGVGWGFARMREAVLASGQDVLVHQAQAGRTTRINAQGRSWVIHSFPQAEGASPLAIVEFGEGAPLQIVLARDHSLGAETAADAEGVEREFLRFRLSAPDGAYPGWARIIEPGSAVVAESGELAMEFESAAARRRRFANREYTLSLSQNIRLSAELRDEVAALARKQEELALDKAEAALAGSHPTPVAGPDLAAARSSAAGLLTRLRYQEMEIHRKLSMTLAPFALALLGIALGLRVGRGGIMIGFSVGIAAVAVVYYPLWVAGQSLALTGMLPPVVALWATPAIIGAAGGGWLSRML